MPTWSERLAIGVPLIDKQHRCLFSRLDRLLGAMKERRSGPEVLALVEFLEDYVTEHFAAEEAIIAERLPSALERHAAAHEGFRVQLTQLAAQVRAGRAGPTATLELQQFVSGWLVDHVASADQALRVLAPGGDAPTATAERPAPAVEVRPGRPASAFAPVSLVHRDVAILRLDFRALDPTELLEAFDVAGDRIRSAPHASLRIVTLLASMLTTAGAAAFKAYALRNRPHVRASAIVGNAFWRVIVADLQARGRDDLVVFDDEARALDWVASR